MKALRFFCEKHFRQRSIKKFISDEKINRQTKKSTQSHSQQNIYQSSFKQAKIEQDQKKTCAGCDKYINSSEYIFAENSYWHSDHFTCWSCEHSLGGQKYIVVNSKPHCVTCHSLIFSKSCHTCKLNIEPDLVRLTYDKLDWHAEETCFKCSCCSMSLLETHFLLKDNLLFCSMECKRKLIPSSKLKSKKNIF